VAFRQPEACVDLASHRAHWPIGYHCEGGANVHACHESITRTAVHIHSLIDQADAANSIVLNQGFGYRHARPELNHSRTGHLLAHPLIELAEREDHAVVFAHELWSKGQFDCVIAQTDDRAERPDQSIFRSERKRTPARSDGIQ
jgi:hypothetical protein